MAIEQKLPPEKSRGSVDALDAKSVTMMDVDTSMNHFGELHLFIGKIITRLKSKKEEIEKETKEEISQLKKESKEKTGAELQEHLALIAFAEIESEKSIKAYTQDLQAFEKLENQLKEQKPFSKSTCPSSSPLPTATKAKEDLPTLFRFGRELRTVIIHLREGFFDLVTMSTPTFFEKDYFINIAIEREEKKAKGKISPERLFHLSRLFAGLGAFEQAIKIAITIDDPSRRSKLFGLIGKKLRTCIQNSFQLLEESPEKSIEFAHNLQLLDQYIQIFDLLLKKEIDSSSTHKFEPTKEMREFYQDKISSLIESNQINKAIEILHVINLENNQIRLVYRFIPAIVNKGKLDTFLRPFDTVEKNKLLRKISLEFLSTQSFDQAISIAEKITDLSDKDQTFYFLSKSLSKKKECKRAISLTQQIQDKKIKADSLQYTSEILAESGDFNKALQIARELASLDEEKYYEVMEVIILELAKVGSFNRVSEIIKALPQERRGKACQRIIEERIYLKKFHETLKLVDLFTEEDREISLLKMIQVYSENKSFDIALALTKSLKDIHKKEKIFRELHGFLHKTEEK